MIRHYEAAFDGTPAAVREVRRFLGEVLAVLPAPVVDDAVLCASEMATNAVLHSASGRDGGKFRVVAEISADRLQVDVIDQGGPTPVILPSRADTSEHHRGLPIVAALGALRVDGDDTGHRVSAVLPLTRLETP